MIGWPNLPYELIGKASVVLVAIALTLLLALVAVVAFVYVWVRLMDRLTNALWWGYDAREGRLPPRWRLELSFYAQALRSFDLSLVETFRENERKLKSAGTRNDRSADTDTDQ